ncbi:MAG: hypothetical protein ACK53X_04315 [Holosporales bacterium]
MVLVPLTAEEIERFKSKNFINFSDGVSEWAYNHMESSDKEWINNKGFSLSDYQQRFYALMSVEWSGREDLYGIETRAKDSLGRDFGYNVNFTLRHLYDLVDSSPCLSTSGENQGKLHVAQYIKAVQGELGKYYDLAISQNPLPESISQDWRQLIEEYRDSFSHPDHLGFTDDEVRTLFVHEAKTPIGDYINDFRRVTEEVSKILPPPVDDAYLGSNIDTLVKTLSAASVRNPLEKITWQDEEEKVQNLRDKHPERSFSIPEVPIGKVVAFNTSVKNKDVHGALEAYGAIARGILDLRTLPDTSRLPIAAVAAIAKQWLSDNQQPST